MNKVDILAIGAHPDDVELSCSGTLLKQIAKGGTVAICDLTQGELGTRGNAALRFQEAEASRKVLGVKYRENLALPDGFFEADRASLIELVRVIRKYQPEIVLANAIKDRHPDHGKGAEFVEKASFLAGLMKIETEMDGESQERWRPRAVYHYIQDQFMRPDLVVDITDFLEKKMESIQCFRSQFFDPNSAEPDSPISGEGFLDYIKAKNKVFGRYINADFAEGFRVSRPIGVSDLLILD